MCACVQSVSQQQSMAVVDLNDEKRSVAATRSIAGARHADIAAAASAAAAAASSAHGGEGVAGTGGAARPFDTLMDTFSLHEFMIRKVRVFICMHVRCPFPYHDSTARCHSQFTDLTTRPWC